MFRDRWECGHIGTCIFVVQAALLVPYIVIAVMGGGTALRAISGGLVPYWLGGAIVALVVMTYVFLGGMRGTALVNTFQAVLFFTFGTIALMVIGSGMGGFTRVVEEMANSPALAPMLTRESISPAYFFSYTFIPLSSIAFPHICIFCLTAKRMAHFRKTVIAYPLCLMAVWLPPVFLGVIANTATHVPEIAAKLAARANGVMVPADDVVILMLGQSVRTDLARGHPRRRNHGGSHGERFADPRALDDVRGGRVRVLRSPGQVRRAHAGVDRQGVRRHHHGAGICWTAVTTIVQATLPPTATIYGFMPVVPMVLGSAVLMVVVSLLTPAPSASTVERYFPVKAGVAV